MPETAAPDLWAWWRETPARNYHLAPVMQAPRVSACGRRGITGEMEQEPLVGQCCHACLRCAALMQIARLEGDDNA